MSDRLIHIPLYVKEMLASFTEFTTLAERGAYISLMVAFVQNDGELPTDDEIYFKTMCFHEEDKKVLEKVLKKFDKKELENVIKKQKKLREKRREAGRRGGRKSRKIKEEESKQKVKQNVSKPMLKQSESESESDLDKKINNKKNILGDLAIGSCFDPKDPVLDKLNATAYARQQVCDHIRRRHPAAEAERLTSLVMGDSPEGRKFSYEMWQIIKNKKRTA